MRPIAAAVALSLSVAVPALAEEQEKQPLWELGVIGGAVTMPAYPAATERSTRGLVSPYIIYRGRIFRSDESGIGARLLHTDRIDFDIGFAASLPARSGAIAAREGMPNLGALGEFGPRLRVKIGNTETTRLSFQLPVRTVIEARGGLHQRGWTAEPGLAWSTEKDYERFAAGTSFSAVFGDAGINRYFYEVAPQHATATRPAYAAKSGLMLVRMGASANYWLTRDLKLYGYVRAESYKHSANQDSPLYKKSTGYAAGVAVAWIFSRSSRPAHE